MGANHLTKLGRRLSAEAKGKYAVTQVRRYDEDKRSDQRYELVQRKDDKTVATMSVQSLPGCCGIALFHNFSGNADGITEFVRIGREAARKAGYGLSLVTFRAGNDVLGHIGGERIEFVNGKTGNTVVVVTTVLPQETKPVRATETE